MHGRVKKAKVKRPELCIESCLFMPWVGHDEKQLEDSNNSFKVAAKSGVCSC